MSSRWEPRWRFTRHPILSNAARTRFALLAGQLLIWNREGSLEGGRRKFLVCNTVGNDLYSEALGVTDRFITSPPVTHHARKLKGINDPATVFLPIQAAWHRVSAFPQMQRRLWGPKFRIRDSTT
jgi:hypothetical protein